MRIGIDLDGCCYDFVESLRNYLVGKHLFDRKALPHETCWEFFEVDWGIPLDDFLRYSAEGVDAGLIFGIGAPINDFRGDSMAALRALKGAGHSIHLVTDRKFGSRSAQNTARWLGDWDVPFDSLTITSDKTEVKTDIFIDDRPKNIDALLSAGVDAWLLDNYRKDQQDHDRLIPNWEAFVKIVQRRAAL